MSVKVTMTIEVVAEDGNTAAADVRNILIGATCGPLLMSPSLNADDLGDLQVASFNPAAPVADAPVPPVIEAAPKPPRRTRKTDQVQPITPPVDTAPPSAPTFAPATVQSVAPNAAVLMPPSTPAPVVEGSLAPKKPVHNMDQTRDVLMKVREVYDTIGQDGMTEAFKILQRFDVKLVKDMKPDQFDAIYAEAEKALAAVPKKA